VKGKSIFFQYTDEGRSSGAVLRASLKRVSVNKRGWKSRRRCGGLAKQTSLTPDAEGRRGGGEDEKGGLEGIPGERGRAGRFLALIRETWSLAVRPD